MDVVFVFASFYMTMHKFLLYSLFVCACTFPIFLGSIYNNLCKKVSVITDQSLNEDVSRQLLEESPMDTKSDLIIESAEEGALSLLKKWPDMKNKLYICLNQPLPLHIRQLTWRLYLSNTRGKKDYQYFLCLFHSDLPFSVHSLTFFR